MCVACEGAAIEQVERRNGTLCDLSEASVTITHHHHGDPGGEEVKLVCSGDFLRAGCMVDKGLIMRSGEMSGWGAKVLEG